MFRKLYRRLLRWNDDAASSASVIHAPQTTSPSACRTGPVQVVSKQCSTHRVVSSS